MEKETKENLSAAVLRLWMIIAGVVQLKSVKTLEEITQIDKDLGDLKIKRKIKVLQVQSLKLELVSYQLSIITLPLGRNCQGLTLIEERVLVAKKISQQKDHTDNYFNFSVPFFVIIILHSINKWYLFALACLGGQSLALVAMLS